MAVLNVTADSFSDGGKLLDGWDHVDIDKVVDKVGSLIDMGADIIDVGGESTRPGATLISADEEITRVIPVIDAIKKRFDVTISVDTYKAVTAKEAVKAGASIVNDIGMLRLDPDMSKTVASLDVRYVLTHNIGTTEIRNKNDIRDYVNLSADKAFDMKGIELAGQCYVNQLLYELKTVIGEAKKSGIKKENIIIDPGLGFCKTYEQNMTILKYLDRLTELGYPVLLGSSRKSFIGKATGADIQNRDSGTVATTVMGVLAGIDIVRVHDVASNVNVIRMTEAVMNM